MQGRRLVGKKQKLIPLHPSMEQQGLGEATAEAKYYEQFTEKYQGIKAMALQIG